MKPETILLRLGGVADAKTLVRLTSRAKVRASLERGTVVRDTRGRYSLPTADEGLRAANRLSGVASHGSAAAYWGWETKTPPELPAVTVPRNRKVDKARRQGVEVKWAELDPGDVVQGKITAPGRTVMDCAKDLPFDEALAVADSAVRHRNLTPARLVELAGAMPRMHRVRCLRVAQAADGRAANPFESVLRAISLDVAGIDLEPQVVISQDGLTARPDLVDRRRRIVVEAESFEFHGQRRALKRDCERYNALARLGWTVIRFSWEHVMFAPEYVAETLGAVATGRHLQPIGRAPSGVEATVTA